MADAASQKTGMESVLNGRRELLMAGTDRPRKPRLYFCTVIIVLTGEDAPLIVATTGRSPSGTLVGI